MMGKHVRFENLEFGEIELKKIGSRIFPPRGTPPSMPSLATRRSTRVFVRKKLASDGDSAVKVLRSGKRLSPAKSVVNRTVGEENGSSPDWMELFGNSAAETENGDEWKRYRSGHGSPKRIKEGLGKKLVDTVEKQNNMVLDVSLKQEPVLSLHNVAFYGIFYGRKRRRSHLDYPLAENSFKALWNSLLECLRSLSSDSGITFLGNLGKKRRLSLLDRELESTRTACRIADKVLIPQRYLCFGLIKPAALVLLLQSSTVSTLDRFSSLLFSILSGIMNEVTSIQECSSFLSLRRSVCLLSLNEIQSLPLKSWKPEFYQGLSTYTSGFCVLLRSQTLIPRVSVNFSALPSLFKSWHLSIFHHLIYHPTCTSRYNTDVSSEEQRLRDYLSRANLATSSSIDSESVIIPSLALASEESSSTVIRSLSRINASKIRKRARKRSLARNGRVPRRTQLKLKVHPIQDSLERGTLIQKRRRTSSINYTKDLDALSCAANVLIIESDRCWRERGAKVTLELSDSQEWFLAVKVNDSNLFMHKAVEMKPSSSNRFTHALIWVGESGWKLEFPDKNEWGVFKELHKECMERNSQAVTPRTVPIPGVREVTGYEESCPSQFKRPDSYIRSGFDEVERVLMSEYAVYDMDSGDEEWLEKFNAADRETGISADDFEMIVTVLEKAAWGNPDEVADREKAAAACSKFGDWSRIGDVHEYWMKKRRVKHLPLVSVFQGQPPKKKQQQLTQKPHLRKKRSLKRQASQSVRGNADTFYEGAAKLEAVERFHTAESAASRYGEAAVKLRSKAETLMVNADLAVYKAAMALKLAEAIRGGHHYHDLSYPG